VGVLGTQAQVLVELGARGEAVGVVGARAAEAREELAAEAVLLAAA
jgi:hypothetical protein